MVRLAMIPSEEVEVTIPSLVASATISSTVVVATIQLIIAAQHQESP
jgi:hypothetical protein